MNARTSETQEANTLPAGLPAGSLTVSESPSADTLILKRGNLVSSALFVMGAALLAWGVAEMASAFIDVSVRLSSIRHLLLPVFGVAVMLAAAGQLGLVYIVNGKSRTIMRKRIIAPASRTWDTTMLHRVSLTIVPADLKSPEKVRIELIDRAGGCALRLCESRTEWNDSANVINVAAVMARLLALPLIVAGRPANATELFKQEVSRLHQPPTMRQAA